MNITYVKEVTLYLNLYGAYSIFNKNRYKQTVGLFLSEINNFFLSFCMFYAFKIYQLNKVRNLYSIF